MTCIHLKEINRLCTENGLVLGRTDLVRIVCAECGEQDVCPVNSVDTPISDEVQGRLPVVALSSHAMNSHAIGS